MDLPQMPSGPRAAHPSMPLPLPAAGADLQLRLRDVTPDRFCPTCQRWKQPNYFYVRGTGRSRDCKPCHIARVIRDRQLRAASTIRPGFPGVDIDRIHYKLGKVKTTLRRSKSNYRLN